MHQFAPHRDQAVDLRICHLHKPSDSVLRYLVQSAAVSIPQPDLLEYFTAQRTEKLFLSVREKELLVSILFVAVFVVAGHEQLEHKVALLEQGESLTGLQEVKFKLDLLSGLENVGSHFIEHTLGLCI